MSEILVQFDEPQLSADGRMFVAEVRGRRLTTGLWEAWIEFQPRVGGEPVRTPPATEQLSRGDLRFWAAGITRDQLNRALADALQPGATSLAGRANQPHQSANPTGTQTDRGALPDPTAVVPQPVLDPMALYRHSGEYTLRQELRSLDAVELAEIINAYHIEDMDVVDLARTYEDALAERIVAGVQHNVESIRTFPDGNDAEMTK
jgi:hypothetical protein